ncbi:MAG: ParA family protein [Clostridia bacterium]
MKNNITIICGHYGCGKTNFAINLAIEKAKLGEDVVLVDMDVVNPYFRACEYKDLLEENGISLISPSMSNTTLDTPSISAAVYSVFNNQGKTVIIDLGGDDVGATALGMFREKIEEYEMIYVINKNRIQSSSEEDALVLLREIEFATKLKATSVVNNTHLGVETTEKILLEALPFAQKFAEISGLRLLYSTAPSFCSVDGFKIIERLVKFPWE